MSCVDGQKRLLHPKMCPCPKGTVEPSAAPAPEPPVKKRRGRPPGTVTPWLKRAREEAASSPLVAQVDKAFSEVDKTAALLRLMQSLNARDNFGEFCRQAWHVTEPGTALQWNWHHQLICNVLQALFESWQRGRIDTKYLMPVVNTVFSVAPGSLKSRLIMVFFMAWCWLHAPSMKFIALSVNEDATLRDARACRDLIKSDWYQGSFKPDWRLKGDQDAISNYGNTAGGERLSKPSGSAIVGLRGDCVAGESLVSTEVGNVPIAELHEMPADQRPRVWSVDHVTGDVVLRRILGTRRIADRPVIEVRAGADYGVKCTRDHRIYVQGEYVPAAEATGRTVSVVRRARDEVVAQGNTAAVREMPLRDARVRGVYDDVHALGRGVRQAEGARADGGAVLLEGVQDARGQSASDLEMVRALQRAVSPALSKGEQAVLFEDVLRDCAAREAGGVRLRVSGMSASGQVQFATPQVLRQDMRRSRALEAHGGIGQLELQGADREPVSGWVVGEPGSADSRARWPAMCGMFDAAELSRDAGTPHRRGPGEQRTGEPDHALRLVPRYAPPVVDTTAATVHECLVDGRPETIDVYDIHVEGTHNFFAGGVLVHNCILYDDPNSPDENQTERENVNTVWDASIYSRVNSPTRSFRIGVQQRVADGDWTSHVIENQGLWSLENRYGWLNVVLPAEYEPERKFVMPDVLAEILREKLPLGELVLADPRVRDGESVHPDRFTEEMLKAERERWEGTGNYAAQYQQRPALAEGGAIKRKWFNWCRLEAGVRDEFDEHRQLAETRDRPPDTDHDVEALLIKHRVHSPGHWDLDWLEISVDCAAKKPCHVDGRVVVRDKGTVRLGDVEVGDQILTHEGRYRAVLQVAEQGELPLVHLQTFRGRDIKVAGSHPMLTQRGWVRADDVVVGDTLAEVHAREVCNGRSGISNEESRLIGYLLGDGCLTRAEPASFTNIDEITQADFKHCVEAVGLQVGRRRKVHPGRRTSDVGILAGPNHEGHVWVERHGLRGKDAYTKRVPLAVMEASDEAVVHFLAAYWACDGCISDRRDDRRPQANRSVTAIVNSVSKELLQDVQQLLSRLGISMTLRRCVTNKKTKRQGDKYVSWRLSSSDQDTVAKFMARVGPYIRHAKRDKAPTTSRVDFNRVLVPDAVVGVSLGERGNCRCLEVEQDHTFVYQGVAVHNTERGSQWGMIVVAGKGNRRFVLDDRTKRGDILEIIEILKDLVKLWRPDCILIEDKAAGNDLKMRLLEQMVAGDMPVVRIDDAKTGNRGKEERLDSCKPILANRFVHLLDGAPWITAFVEELAMFPNGRHDDRVDALTQSLNHHLPEELADDLPDNWGALAG